MKLFTSPAQEEVTYPLGQPGELLRTGWSLKLFKPWVDSGPIQNVERGDAPLRQGRAPISLHFHACVPSRSAPRILPCGRELPGLHTGGPWHGCRAMRGAFGSSNERRWWGGGGGWGWGRGGPIDSKGEEQATRRSQGGGFRPESDHVRHPTRCETRGPTLRR